MAGSILRAPLMPRASVRVGGPGHLLQVLAPVLRWHQELKLTIQRMQLALQLQLAIRTLQTQTSDCLTLISAHTVMG